MTRTRYYQMHRLARLGNLGSLSCSAPRAMFSWFLREIYELRNPRIGDHRHLAARTFDSLRGKMTRRGHHLVRTVFP